MPTRSHAVHSRKDPGLPDGGRHRRFGDMLLGVHAAFLATSAAALASAPATLSASSYFPAAAHLRACRTCVLVASESSMPSLDVRWFPQIDPRAEDVEPSTSSAPHKRARRSELDLEADEA